MTTASQREDAARIYGSKVSLPGELGLTGRTSRRSSRSPDHAEKRAFCVLWNRYFGLEDIDLPRGRTEASKSRANVNAGNWVRGPVL
jgi:hypothetical protein